MVKPSKYFKLQIEDEEDTTIIHALRQRGRYDSNLLYRFFTIDRNDQKTARIEEILARGTDRTSDHIKSEDDPILTHGPGPGGHLLKPSEYLYAAPEDEIIEQLNGIDRKGRDIFVSVYDNIRMIEYDVAYCFEFKDKEKPQDALIALIELEYKAVKGW